MLGQRPEPGRGGEEKPAREPQPEAAGAGAAAAPAAEAGGLKAWLPLIVALVAMPILAFAMTTFVLVPRLQKALRSTGAPAEAAKEGRHEAEGAPAKEGTAAAAGQRQSASLNKLLVNVAGTMGSRYLLTSITLMGDGADFKDRVKNKEPQMIDLANGLLRVKTIADLEKPGACNVIRGELLAGFNTILGNPPIQEIYFTEFAIQ